MVSLRRMARPRPRLFAVVNHPITDMVVMLLIIVSVMLVVVEESLGSQAPKWVSLVNELVTGIFAIELFLRFRIAKKKRRFFRRYWPDLLALLPLLRPLRFFSFFRLFRLFRLFQLGLLLDRRVAVLRGLLRINFYFLWALVVVTFFLVLGSGVIGFLLEHHQQAPFATIQESLWWALYTVIAGEPVTDIPQTFLGRGLLAIMMLGGMTLFAIFTGTVSATMIDRLHGTTRISEMDIDELDGHILIFGWHSGARPLIAELNVDQDLRGTPVVLVNGLEEAPDLKSTGLRSDLVYHLQGDYTQVPTLEQSGVRRASRAVVLADDVVAHDYATRDARTVLAALTIERLNPDIYCVVELVEAAHKDTLKMAKVEVVIMRSELAGRALASACRGMHVMDVMMNLLTMRRGEMIHRLPGPEKPMPFGRLLSELKAETDSIVIAIERGGEARVNPSPTMIVEPDDWLLVIGGSRQPQSDLDS